MKKLIIILALLPFVFTSCKKSNDYTTEKTDKELFEVKISVEGLNQQLRPMITKSASNIPSPSEQLKYNELANYLDIFIFGADNKLVTRKNIILLDVNGNPYENADKFTLELPKGDYSISVVAHNGSIYSKITDLEQIFISYSSYKDSNHGRNIISYSEVYGSSIIKFKVQKNETLTPIKLNRLNSRLELEIKDEVPSDLGYILIGGYIPTSVYPFNSSYFAEYASSQSYIKFDVSTESGKKNLLLSSLIIPPSDQNYEKGKIEILLFSHNNTLLSSKIISNVEFKSNFITKLTGNIFDELNGIEHSNNASVDFEKDYSNEKINISF